MNQQQIGKSQGSSQGQSSHSSEMKLGHETEHRIFCLDHSNYAVTHFCRYESCLKGLCKRCIKEHNLFHKDRQEFAEIETIEDMNASCQSILEEKISAHAAEQQNILDHLAQEESKHRDLQIDHRIKDCATQCLSIVQNYFEGIRAELATSIKKTTALKQRIHVELEDIQTEKIRLLALREDLQANTFTLSTIQYVLTHDFSQALLQKLGQLSKQFEAISEIPNLTVKLENARRNLNDACSNICYLQSSRSAPDNNHQIPQETNKQSRIPSEDNDIMESYLKPFQLSEQIVKQNQYPIIDSSSQQQQTQKKKQSLINLASQQQLRSISPNQQPFQLKQPLLQTPASSATATNHKTIGSQANLEDQNVPVSKKMKQKIFETKPNALSSPRPTQQLASPITSGVTTPKAGQQGKQPFLKSNLFAVVSSQEENVPTDLTGNLSNPQKIPLPDHIDRFGSPQLNLESSHNRLPLQQDASGNQQQQSQQNLIPYSNQYQQPSKPLKREQTFSPNVEMENPTDNQSRIKSQIVSSTGSVQTPHLNINSDGGVYPQASSQIQSQFPSANGLRDPSFKINQIASQKDPIQSQSTAGFRDFASFTFPNSKEFSQIQPSVLRQQDQLTPYDFPQTQGANNNATSNSITPNYQYKSAIYQPGSNNQSQQSQLQLPQVHTSYIQQKSQHQFEGQNPFQIDQPNQFESDCNFQYVHFFQPKSNILHIISLEDLKVAAQGISPNPKNYLRFYAINIGNSDENDAFSVPRFHKSVATKFGDIFLIGGVSASSSSSCLVYKYNFSSNKLVRVTDMSTGRSGFGCVYSRAQHAIYVIGGATDEDGVTTKCERYDIKTNTWQPIAQLNQPAFNPAVCTFSLSAAPTSSSNNQRKHYLYKYGGKIEENSLNQTVERYDISSNIWEIISIPGLSGILLTSSVAVQINDSSMFIFGGTGLQNHKSSQSFLIQVTSNEQQKSPNWLSHQLKQINSRELPYAEGFSNQQVIFHENQLYVIQNVSEKKKPEIIYLDRKRVLTFNQNTWATLNSIELINKEN